MTDATKDVQNLYDGAAARWVRNEPLSLSDFTGRPAVLAMCEPVAGARVLDLGCGEGYCTRRLRLSGAREAIGIDLSSAMIEAARAQEEREPLGISYQQGDAADLSRFPPGSFDLILSMFMFNYLPLAQTRRCMVEVVRLLRPGGRFVFASPHPSFAFLRVVRSEAEAPPFYFQVNGRGYFSGRDGRFPGRIWKRDGTPLDVQLCHKTLEDYFWALKDAGFRTLPIVRELRVTPEIRALDPSFFGPLDDCPLHLAMSIMR